MTNASPKQGLATGKLYRGITIYCNSDGTCTIYDSHNQAFPFVNWNEAIAFVDAWYAAQQIVDQSLSYTSYDA